MNELEHANFEDLILKHIIYDERYYGIVYPHLKENHFQELENNEIFKGFKKYVNKYERKPSPKELILFFKNNITLTEKVSKAVFNKLKVIINDKLITNDSFLTKETEKYIQKIELTNAILSSAEILEKNQSFDNVIGLIENALSVTFDTNLGMQYTKSIKDRYEYYTQKILGVPMGIRSIDKALAGGFRSKTLNLFVAPSHGGKSALLISTAASYLLRKKDVLFISLEMTEYEIGKRIDANLSGISANELKNISKDEFFNKMNKIDTGELFIKEYPAGTFNTLKLKALLKELESEENFKPDLIVIDYIGLMSSSRANLSQAGGMYQYYKLIAEELHGFSKEYDKILLSASQLNRSAYNSLDAGLDTISDSLGVIQTADIVLAILSTEELRSENKAVLKFLKNRYTGSLSSHIVQAEFDKVRFYDLEDDVPNKISQKVINNIATGVGTMKELNTLTNTVKEEIKPVINFSD